MVRLPFVVIAAGLVACAPEHVVGGRPYTLHLPRGADPATPLPLLILLHGFGVTGEAQELIFGFSDEVNARQFLYAEPDGTADSKGKRFWNGTDACCNFDHLAVDDVGFVRALVKDVAASHPVDLQKVFVVGHSNGGFMALRLACEAGDLIRGVVSLAGATWLDAARCPSGPPVSVLLVHGTADTVIAYAGGSTDLAAYPSARATRDAFSARNGCVGPSTVLGMSDFLADASEETKREGAEGCAAGTRVELWTVEGGPHIPLFNAAWRRAVLDWLPVAPR